MTASLLFLGYLFCVLYLTLFNREATYPRHMLKPFWEYEFLFSGDNQRYYFQQIFCNILMLMPLGFFLPWLFPNLRNWKTVLIGFCFSVWIELTQYFTARGLCECDDIFNNTLGCLIGYLLWKLYDKKFSH